MLKQIQVIFFLGAVFCYTSSHALSKSCSRYTISLQDSVWKRYTDNMVLDSRLREKKEQLTREEYLILHENYLRKMRADGLEVWKTHPNEIGRYSWLIFTVGVNVPSYYDFTLNRFDTEEKEKWDNLYPILKKNYVDYIDKEVPPDQPVKRKRHHL